MKKSYLTRKENIVLTAIEIIDELGLQGLTIREIAGREEVTEAAIYRHFKSKEEIILGVLDKFSYFDLMIQNTIIDQNFNAREAIVFFVKSYVEYYENYPAITAMLFTFDAFRNEAGAMNKMIEISNGRLNVLKNVIEQGQNQDELSKELSAEDLVYIIFGMINFITQMWRADNCSFNLKERIMSTLETLLGYSRS